MTRVQRFLIGMTSIAIVAAVGVYQGVYAQGRGEEKGMNLDVTVSHDQDMPIAEQVIWLDAQTLRAKGIYRRVQTMLDSARNEKDTIKITCLDDKLTQIHVNLRGIEKRREAHVIAVNQNDVSAANQQFSIMKIYFTKVTGLAAESENCIGDVDVIFGETETTLTIDDDITQEDPSEYDYVVIIIIDPTPHASGHY